MTVTQAKPPVKKPDEPKEDDEPIEGPPSKADPNTPKWWLQEEPKNEPFTTASPAEVEKDRAESNDIVVDAIDIIHDKAAEATGYEGFRLTEKEKNLWRRVIKFLLRKLPMKDWPVIVCIVTLALAETAKVMGYLKDRKAPTAPTPTKAKPIEPPKGAFGEPSMFGTLLA